MAEKHDAKDKAKGSRPERRPSALESYVPGPPVTEPDDVGEVPGVEPDGAAASPAEGAPAAAS